MSEKNVESADLEMIPVADPGSENIALRDGILHAIQRVIDSGTYSLGSEVEMFEAEFAKFVGAKFAVGVANGTDGLALTLMGLGLGAGDEVITVSHTAVATVAGIEMAGCTPVLVDVETQYYTIDVKQLSEVITSRTRAIIAVHIYGQMADMADLQSFCDAHGLLLLEDASQAHGAMIRQHAAGSVGVAGIFSLYPTKNLGAIGDAGIVVTSDQELALSIRRLRQYGWQEKNWSLVPGVNSRLDELQAALLREKLSRLSSFISRRQEIAALYDQSLQSLPLVIPRVRPETSHAYHLYVVLTDGRAPLQEFLFKRRIRTGIHYPYPVHRQPAYSGRIRTAASMQVSEKLSSEALSLPMYPSLSDYAVERIIADLHLYYSCQGGIA